MSQKWKTVTEEKQQNNEKEPKQAADDKEAKKDIFSWSDDEIQLLFMACLRLLIPMWVQGDGKEIQKI